MKKKAKSSEKKSSKKSAIFEFSAPDAKEVSLAGDFNDWDVKSLPLRKDKNGLWKIKLPLTPGCYQYKYILDGQWVNDPQCTCCVPNAFGTFNCQIRVE